MDELEDDLNDLTENPINCTQLENQVLIHNILHLASQLADNLILATGGVLPILASATSPSFELDVVEASQGLCLADAWTLLDRIMIVVDLTLNLDSSNYPNVISIHDIESEKAIQNGGILRQFLRLIAVTSVRNSLETRYSLGGAKVDVEIPKLLATMANANSAVTDSQFLLQDKDVRRLRATVYREVDDAKNSQFLALASVYLVSVLGDKDYRDLGIYFNNIQKNVLVKKLQMFSTNQITRFLNCEFRAKTNR